MNIEPTEQKQSISDDQELAKVLAGINNDAGEPAPVADAVMPAMPTPPTPPPVADDAAAAVVADPIDEPALPAVPAAEAGRIARGYQEASPRRTPPTCR